jgi:diaminohydroxyphosphoribosylaminopyrimidine deaminase/5-amino-6-(5-phosphoribosylamino)uracil reductase
VAGAGDAVEARLPSNVTVVSTTGSVGATIDVDAVLHDLGERGMQSVLIEGGARTAGRFHEAGRIDAVAWFRGASLLGDHGGRPALDAAAVEAPARAPSVRVEGRLAFGEDDVVIGRIAGAKEVPCSPD